MTQSEWGRLKLKIQSKLDTSQWRSLKETVFEQKPSMVEYARFLGLEEVLFEYLDQGKYFNEVGIFNINPLKDFFKRVITVIDPNAEKAFLAEVNKYGIKIFNFIDNPTLENMVQLNDQWILDQIQLDYADENQKYWINEFFKASSKDDQEIFNEFIQQNKNKEIISKLQQELDSVRENITLKYPSWYYKHFFRALIFPESLSSEGVQTSMLDIPPALKSKNFYKLQFCEPKKFIAGNNNTYVFIGEISGKIFISHSLEMPNGEIKLQDFVVTTDDIIINSSHFDPYHINSPTKHRNYSSGSQDKLSLPALASATKQPIELLKNYFTSIANGPHTHIFFPLINEMLEKKVQNDTTISDDKKTAIIEKIRHESIAISVADIARYTRDIFLATARNIDNPTIQTYCDMLEIKNFNPSNESGLISYEAPNEEGTQTDYTISNLILNNDLGMHYTMFADGTLTYDPLPLLKFLVRVLRQKGNSVSQQAVNEIMNVKEFIDENEEIKNLCYYVSNVADNQNSAFGTNSKILQEFNSSVLYLGDLSEEEKEAKNAPKPLETTFVVALIFKIFNNVTSLLTPDEIAQATSIIQGKFIVPAKTKDQQTLEPGM